MTEQNTQRSAEHTQLWYDKIEDAIKNSDFDREKISELNLDEWSWMQLKNNDFARYLIRRDYLSVERALALTTEENNWLKQPYIQYAIEVETFKTIDDVFEELKKPDSESRLILKFVKKYLIPNKLMTSKDYVGLSKDQLMLLNVSEIQWAICSNTKLLPQVLKLTYNQWEERQDGNDFKIEDLLKEDEIERTPKKYRFFIDPTEDEKRRRQNSLERQQLLGKWDADDNNAPGSTISNP